LETKEEERREAAELNEAIRGIAREKRTENRGEEKSAPIKDETTMR
jgi:hypothetical protein